MRAFSSPTIRDFISDLRIRALSHIKWAFVFPGTALLPLRNQSISSTSQISCQIRLVLLVSETYGCVLNGCKCRFKNRKGELK
ncbi:hypothetical protein TNCT_432561 [Trichonephila clavata]|uniref:Uncharacterized protein n=1 Tax=Trichonephila clavata TaxID=2740835 RepID=A0A8X6EZ99_TRICU|nr:hypothetical protein TNCT_432561 [Trichonephila clavata]